MSRVRLLLVVLLAATTVAARPLDLPAASEKWITLRVDEFTFVSNVSAARTKSIARDLLSMRDAIGRVTDLQVRSSKPTRIFIFASEEAFAPYREALLGSQATGPGLFKGAAAGNFIVLKGGGQTNVARTVYHELTHYFVHTTMAGLPLWADEGMAEYFSTFRTSDGFLEIGWPIDAHLQWLRQDKQKFIPLRELMAATSDSPLYKGHSPPGVFHAQSWALIHYLRTDDARSAQMNRYVRLVAAGKPIDDAFTAAFGKSYAELEKEFRAYVRGPKFAYSAYPVSARELPEIPAAEPISRDALLYELGHLLAHAATERRNEAQRFLAAALKVNPGHSGAHADIGWLHFLAGRRQEADASFARALELGNDDPVVHLLIGTSALEELNRNLADAGAARELRLKARNALVRSVELDPSLGVAWMGIGATYLLADEDPLAGIAAMEKAAALSPGDVNVSFGLVQLYARAGRREEAQHLIDTVLARSAKRELLDSARGALLLADARQVDTLAAAGKTEEAAELARSLAARTTDASFKAHLEKAIVQLDDVSRTNRGVRAINDAIAKANAGKVVEAITIIDGALPFITDPELLRKAHDLRAGFAWQATKKR